jgi:hypothetical protein
MIIEPGLSEGFLRPDVVFARSGKAICFFRHIENAIFHDFNPVKNAICQKCISKLKKSRACFI